MNLPSLQAICAIRPSQEVLDHLDEIPNCAGVYMIFGDSQELLEGTGYEETESRDPFRVGGVDLLYVGSSSTLRDRIACHFKDDSQASTFRMSMGCLLRQRLDLSVYPHLTKTYFHFGQGEGRLTRWLCQNTAVAIWPCAQAPELEKALIRNLPAPINISDRRTHPYSRYLLTLRSTANGRIHRPRRQPSWVASRKRA
ncbi:MAG TPA: hypothetical protein VL358_05385 [Caulobacteraceae bacterium]|jgi:hypothetical protein|nr:hypothetical protein [Caulobacteraceae bacterium]